MSFRPLTQESLTAVRRRPRQETGALTWSRGLLALGSMTGAAVLFQVYERLSATAPITADSANAVLQGQSMAHGNLLLHGWTLSGASFLATDLPFYAVVEWFRGLSPATAHDVGAVVYTLLVLVAALLARGRAGGTAAAGRMLVAVVLLLAPAPGVAVQLLLLGPFHAGTTLVLLLGLLALDAAGDRPAGAVAFGLLLSLAVLSDALALYVGVVPVVLVCLIRLASRRERPGPDLVVLAAAILAIPMAWLLGWALAQLGGFATVPLQGSFAEIDDMPKNVALTVQGALLLFGANFFGQPLAAASTLPILVHLAGLTFVVLTYRWALQGWRRGDETDRVSQVLVLAMAVDVAAYLFSNQAIDLMTSRYLIPFMAFGAVLAGRVGADRLWRGRRGLVAAAVALAYVGFLGASLRVPPTAGTDAELGRYLERQHLRYGLAAYWQASTVTVATGDRVRVRALDLGAPVPSPYWWEAQDSWYDRRIEGNDARFVVRDTSDPRTLDRGAIEAAFGPPAEVHQFGHYEVMVWDRNLLGDMR
jgi:hypothetical protein